MDKDKVLNIARSLLMLFSGAVVTRGYMTADEYTAFVGAVIAFAGAAWGIYNILPANLLKRAAHLPEVKTIELEPGKVADKVQHLPEVMVTSGKSAKS